MKLTLYVVHGSHPSAAAEKALAIKGLGYRTIEWPPPMHAVMQRLLFDARTVPALRIDGREKVQGSRAIMHRLDELVPSPPLYPSDPQLRAKVEEADEWGDRVLQQVARELIWVGFQNAPAAMVSYTEHSKIPLPGFAIRASAPLIARAQARLNKTSRDVATRARRELPKHLDHVDALIAEGVIGDASNPNAADLQIFTTLRLMQTMADLAPEIDARPCGAAARALFPSVDGQMPAGALPAAA